MQDRKAGVLSEVGAASWHICVSTNEGSFLSCRKAKSNFHLSYQSFCEVWKPWCGRWVRGNRRESTVFPQGKRVVRSRTLYSSVVYESTLEEKFKY